MDILEVRGLTKRFGEFTAVDDISFSLKEGEILGLLGPNGAGKTTTLQMLLGVLTPTAGDIRYFGKSLVESREEILEQLNFSSTYTNLPWNLTVKENLTFISYLYDIKDRKKRLKEIADIFRLEKLWRKTLVELSAGQVTRVNLAKAFINYPKVLLLDEPTASLDLEVANYIRQFLLEERKTFNVSIVITSHNMAEVEEVCDRVLFIDEGKILANDTPENLSRTIEISHVELLINKNVVQAEEYCTAKGLPYKLEGRYAIIDIKDSEIPSLLRDLMGKGITYTEISIEKPTLKDYFLQVVHKDISEAL